MNHQTGQLCRFCRLACLLGAAASALLAADSARAADASCASLPEGSIHWIVPFSPGGASDTFSRLMAPYVEEELQRTILIDNQTGAGGLVGSKMIRDASANGLTVGIISAGGMMVANVLEGGDTPNPVTDYALIGLITDQRSVWVVSQGSPIASVVDINSAAGHPYVMGYQDVGSATFVASVLVSELAGIDLDFVAGYKGSKERLLAMERGEIDLSAAPFETYLAEIDAGEVRPVLQLSERPINDHPSLEGVPLLLDVVAERAAADGRSPDAVAEDIEVVVRLIGTVPVLAAPAGLPDTLLHCWRTTFDSIVANPDFAASVAKAQRTLEPTGGADLEKSLKAVSGRLEPFAKILRERGQEASD